MWHGTRDTWHVTHDKWGEVNLLLKFKLPSTYGSGVKVFWRYFHKAWLIHSMNELIDYKGVCRTALATQGLFNVKMEVPLKIYKFYVLKGIFL